jgi:hypothetical protein
MDTTFPRLYQWRKLTELPNSSIPRFYYPGAKEQGGGDGLLLEISPELGRPWLGIFKFGGISPFGVSGVFTTPNPYVVCVVSKGAGYFVSADTPTSWEAVGFGPILDVRPVPAQGLLIFAGYNELIAFGANGFRWRTQDLVWDDLVITEVTDTHIRGRGWNPQEEAASYRFSVDLSTGEHEKWQAAVKEKPRREQRLKPLQLELLQEIVARRCPTLRRRVRSADIGDLSRLERKTLEVALAGELKESGLREAPEPNPRGREILELIDIISSPGRDDILWRKPAPPGKLTRIGNSAVNLFVLFFALSALFLVVLAIVGGIAKILGIDPLFLGLPVIVLGLRFIFKSSWVTAAIAGISFGTAWFLLYHVGPAGGAPGGPPGGDPLWIMATPAAFTFCLLHYLVDLFVKSPARSSAMSGSVFGPSQRFAFENLYREDIWRVIKFAYDVSERVNQAVYILAFEADGRKIGGPALEGLGEGAVVRLGREDASAINRFGTGDDIVLWRPPSRERSYELIAGHWKEGRICWAIFVDERNTADVVSSIQAAWFHCHALGDHLRLLEESIGPERKLGMLSYDGNCFFGKTTADCWDFALSQLQEISGAELKVYEDRPDLTSAVNFITTPGTEIRSYWYCLLESQSRRCECVLILKELPPIGLGRHTGGIPIKLLGSEAKKPHLQVGDRFTLWEKKRIGRKKLGEGTVEQVIPK